MVDITIVNGVYKQTYNYEAPPCNYEPLQIMINVGKTLS